jgi:hypothetical protein
LVVAPLFKNSTNKPPSLPQKTLAMTLPAEICTWNLFSLSSYLQHRFTTSDFHLFGPLKDAPRGRRFADDDELKLSVREEFRCFSKEFYSIGAQRPT